MPSQFFKRRLKESKEQEVTVASSQEPAIAAEEISDVPDEVNGNVAEPTMPEVANTGYTQTSYDIFIGPDGRNHLAAVIRYNPITLEATVETVMPVSRQVGLVYQNKKDALASILRKR